MKPVILVSGANPAWQKVLLFSSFCRGEVNRVRTSIQFASGKGVNFCRACANYGKAEGLLVQFAGGENLTRIDTALTTEQIRFHSISCVADTRTCTTCIDESENLATELIEPSFPATEEECKNYTNWIAAHINECTGGAVCGTLPTGTNPDLYGKIAHMFACAGKPLLIDSFIATDLMLATGVDAVLKINSEELNALTGEQKISSGIKMLINRYPNLRAVAITCGKNPAWLGERNRLDCFSIPPLEQIVNPIGSGDTASAVFWSEVLCGTPLQEAFACGLAAASANCLSLRCGDFTQKDWQQLHERIVIAPANE